MKKALCAILVLSLITVAICACSAEPREVDDGDYGKTVYACISFEKYGDVYIEMYPDIAPVTVDNFIENANSGLYTDTVIHWIGKDFGIQGGDPTGTGYGLEGQKTIKGEFSKNGVSNKISHIRGTVTMARASGYDSATSQFMILVSDETYLDGKYAAFARVVSGMDVIDEVASIETSEESYYRPAEDVVIAGITIYEYLPEGVILD